MQFACPPLPHSDPLLRARYNLHVAEDSGSDFTLPIALNVRGRRCVIVGGGTVGTRKALSFAEAGATVVVIAPKAQEAIVTAAGRGSLLYQAEPFVPTHLEGAFVAVAATDNPTVNAAVRAAARERGILLNLAADAGTGDDPGDFATMATVRRGDLLLALTTGGAGPALSAKLRGELETHFGSEWSEYVKLLGELRLLAKERLSDPKERSVALRRLVENEDLRTMLRDMGYETARAEGEKCLSR